MPVVLQIYKIQVSLELTHGIALSIRFPLVLHWRIAQSIGNNPILYKIFRNYWWGKTPIEDLVPKRNQLRTEHVGFPFFQGPSGSFRKRPHNPALCVNLTLLGACRRTSMEATSIVFENIS